MEMIKSEILHKFWGESSNTIIFTISFKLKSLSLYYSRCAKYEIELRWENPTIFPKHFTFRLEASEAL